MAQPLRQSTKSPVKTGRLSPVSPSTGAVDGAESVRKLLKSLEDLSRKGGTFSTNGEVRPYAFYGGRHLSTSQVLQENLWKFGFSEMARNVLDHMTVGHDDQGLVEMTQASLAGKFGCSQAKVSRAIGQLTGHHFMWRERRGLYRLNPLYAYRWGSRKQLRLLEKLGGEFLAEHQIRIPERSGQ